MDRTNEFNQYVRAESSSSTKALSSIASNRPAAAKSSRSLPDVPKSRSAFQDAASDIAKGVHRTSNTLSRLTKLVRRQGLFDDPTEEINNLIFRIKQDLDELNTKCDSAQQYVDNKKRDLGEKSQPASHNVKVVSQLKTDLLHATKDFKSILEVRSSKMKDQQMRKVELTGSGTLSPMRQFNASNNSNNNSSNPQQHFSKGASKQFALPSPYNPTVSNNVNNSFGDESGNANSSQAMQQQLLLAPPQATYYYESREQAVTEVEKTISELGQLFKRLATMISEQQELVERIDDDIEAAVATSNNAHSVLLKTYESISSNRALYTKIGAILILFIIFFSIFLM